MIGCPLPHPARCDVPGCRGLDPGEVLECPHPLLDERRPGETPPAYTRRLAELKRTRDRDRAALVQASAAAREVLLDEGLDPDQWTGHVPPAWITSRHGWRPADPSQLRTRQLLLHAHGIALGEVGPNQ